MGKPFLSFREDSTYAAVYRLVMDVPEIRYAKTSTGDGTLMALMTSRRVVEK